MQLLMVVFLYKKLKSLWTQHQVRPPTLKRAAEEEKSWWSSLIQSPCLSQCEVTLWSTYLIIVYSDFFGNNCVHMKPWHSSFYSCCLSYVLIFLLHLLFPPLLDSLLHPRLPPIPPPSLPSARVGVRHRGRSVLHRAPCIHFLMFFFFFLFFFFVNVW